MDNKNWQLIRPCKHTDENWMTHRLPKKFVPSEKTNKQTRRTCCLMSFSRTFGEMRSGLKARWLVANHCIVTSCIWTEMIREGPSSSSKHAARSRAYNSLMDKLKKCLVFSWISSFFLKLYSILRKLNPLSGIVGSCSFAITDRCRISLEDW